MQFHHHGYVSGDPRVQPAAGVGIDRPDRIPDEVDVLIIGVGPAGVTLAAQLSQFPNVTTRLIEKRPERLAVGQADGIQARSVETFQAFGFAEQIVQEAFWLTHMNFWSPDPKNPDHIIRTARTDDDPSTVSEFKHLIVNQARVMDYFIEAAQRGPARVEPDYGIEFKSLAVDRSQEYPVEVHLYDEKRDEDRVVRAKYVVGCDGAHSKVRGAIGRKHIGKAAMHAWAVIDSLSVTDFPDIRTKCAIHSKAGSILLIPREGGHLFRLYVDLGEVPEDGGGDVRKTPVGEAIAQANRIMHPYKIDVKEVPWYSVYEVGHRVTDKFDDTNDDNEFPRVFIAGDACHTHSAKAGQGMNVSIQDTFNLGWKLGQVLSEISPESLLKTYSEERQVIAQNLIDFDRQWSSMMAKKPEEFDSPEELADFYVRTHEFPAGFMTEYEESRIVGSKEFQDLATGFPIGKRFKSAIVDRVADGNPIHLGHTHRADGRWRIYAFADAAAGVESQITDWANWVERSLMSPVNRFTPLGGQQDALFDIKVVYPQPFKEFDISMVPRIFVPRTGPFELLDYEKVFGTSLTSSIFEERGIDPTKGAVVVVRPDQYVATILPLDRPELLGEFFAQSMLEQR
jgi:phenol 2-monooxygenase